MAVGDPQLPQGFYPVTPKTLYPGDTLTVTCDFDSSNQTRRVDAGPTHEHEMCNMYLLVSSPIPHLTMCNNGMVMVDDTTPGTMAR